MNDFEKLMMKYFCLAQNQPEYPTIKYVHDPISGRSYFFDKFIFSIFFFQAFSFLWENCYSILKHFLSNWPRMVINIAFQ